MSPAIVTLDFEPDKEYRLSFNTFGASVITTYLKGDLAPYAELIDPAQGGTPRGFEVILRIPADITPPGPRQLLVGAIEAAPEGSTVGARAAYQSPVNLFVPYPGIYLETRFYAPTVNVDEPVNFTVIILNRGRDTVKRLMTNILVIDDVTNETVAILDSMPTTLNGSEEKAIRLGWETVGHKPGPYRAEAVISYDGQTLKQSETFRVGTQYLRISNFTREVTAGTINPFDILVQSEWNSPFAEVYGEVTLNGSTFKTPSIDVQPWTQSTMSGYWDATHVLPGVYDAEVVVHYGSTFSRLTGPVTVVDRTVIETPSSIGFAGRVVFAFVLFAAAILFLFLRRRAKK